jgi:hypothetical protein
MSLTTRQPELSVTISALEMSLANSASGITKPGVMGPGFDTHEATATIYPKNVDDIVSQGLIAGPFLQLMARQSWLAMMPLVHLVPSKWAL